MENCEEKRLVNEVKCENRLKCEISACSMKVQKTLGGVGKWFLCVKVKVEGSKPHVILPRVNSSSGLLLLPSNKR